MRIELLVVPACPHEAGAVELLRRALDEVGLASSRFEVVTIETVRQAEQRRFLGSPSFAVEGRDLFEDSDRPSAMACRIYPGNKPWPELSALRQALKEAAATLPSR